MNVEEAESSSQPSDPVRPYGGACDTCRRRRVKCDGNQPCQRCMKSNVVCTYGSMAGRTSAISYARRLEEQIAQLQTLLQGQTQLQPAPQEVPVQDDTVDMMVTSGDDVVLESSVTSSNHFFGRFGGFSMLRSLIQSLLLACRHPDTAVNGQELVDAFRELTSPSRGYVRAITNRRTIIAMPSTEIANKAIKCALDVGMIGHDCIDSPDLQARFEHLYSVDPEEYTVEDEQTLALFYALIALGRRYAPPDPATRPAIDSDNVKSRGLSYMQVSFDLVRSADEFTLDSIRAIICQIRYLLAAAMVSQAYSRIALAITAAMRMGLHSSGSALTAHFTSEQLLQRRKVFAVLNMMDTYLSSILGLPKSLKNIDHRNIVSLPDSDYPDDGQQFVKRQPTSPAAESVLCQKLNLILAKISESRSDHGGDLVQLIDGTYRERLQTISKREAELQRWQNDLPALIDEASDVRALQAQLTLRLWHSMAQISLYRPFLHHLSRATNDDNFSAAGYEYGSACVRAAMQAVWLVEAFQSSNILHEAIYLISYSLSYSAAILIMFVMTSPHRATISETTVAAWKAKSLLEWLGEYSTSAKSCSTALSTLLTTLPAVDATMEA